jgi:hypothetical protein
LYLKAFNELAYTTSSFAVHGDAQQAGSNHFARTAASDALDEKIRIESE